MSMELDEYVPFHVVKASCEEVELSIDGEKIESFTDGVTSLPIYAKYIYVQIPGSDCWLNPFGEVRDKNFKLKNSWLRGSRNGAYWCVKIKIDGVWKNKYIHRLVAEIFIPNDKPDTKKFVNHISKDRFDNSTSNLEWVTHEENMKHRDQFKKFV